MSDITKIDKNFKVEATVSREGLRFFNIEQKPFKIDGVFKENGKFRRIPQAVAQSVSDGVAFLHANAAGGRVRFATNSPYIAIHAEMSGLGKMPHFALTGSIGFDLYERDGANQQYLGTFSPPFGIEHGYEAVIDVNNNGLKEYIINFPLYSNVDELHIGLKENSVINAPTDYKYELPVVYYGSSITQGGCASRPGNAYQAIISRKLDCNFINLGFSGSAKGEKEISDYIKNLKMSCFVYDYDHNAPTADYLKATHERMVKEIREANPELPVIMLSRPKYHLTEDEKQRIEIIKTTYLNAVENGDKNVYFISGPELIAPDMIETATVDNCHPNDSGFLSMALKISEVLEGILKNQTK